MISTVILWKLAMEILPNPHEGGLFEKREDRTRGPG
jgi:hypothetical protein